MSEFGGGADVQQIRIIALVMITVLPSSANSGHSRDSCELLKSSNFGHSRPAICTHTFGHNLPFPDD
jgi:hypothetical protein